MLKAIVCVDAEYGIGKDNKLLSRGKADMKQFARLTKDHIMVMGYNTYLEMPKKKENDYRISYVLTHKTLDPEPGTLFLDDIRRVYILADDEDLVAWVIGGATIYEQLLPYCNELHLTRMNQKFEADRFFPLGKNNPNWNNWSIDYGYLLETDNNTGISYRYEVYKRVRNYDGIDYSRFEGGVVDVQGKREKRRKDLIV